MILVTGGAGFIGTNLCQMFKDDAIEFKILDINNSDLFSTHTNIVDICEIGDLRKELVGDIIVHLAAEHADNVSPLSLYEKINIEGTRNICLVAEENNIQKIIFTSSVAVYGFAPSDTNEHGEIRPFNEYGRTKFEAENVLREWYEKDPSNRTLIVIRPTVVYGEGNRGNVYNLLNQIQSGSFVMIGAGKNRKSMAYVKNISAFIMKTTQMDCGYHICNYIDKPDLTMNELVALVRKKTTGKDGVGVRLPLWVGAIVGIVADSISFFTRKKLPISAIRIKKFATNTVFTSNNTMIKAFQPPFTLKEGLDLTINAEFIDAKHIKQ